MEDHICTFKRKSGEVSTTDPDCGVRMCEMPNLVPHLDAGRDYDEHYFSEDSCYLCRALSTEAAVDDIIEHEAPDVAVYMARCWT